MPAAPNPRRLFEEYNTLEYLLLGDLRAALDEPADDSGQRWLIAVIESLLEAMQGKPELMQGVASLPTRKSPKAGPPVGELCIEQQDILNQLRAIHQEMSAATDPGGGWRGGLSLWMVRISQHNERVRSHLKPYFDPDGE